jgi:hypothetical protein
MFVDGNSNSARCRETLPQIANKKGFNISKLDNNWQSGNAHSARLPNVENVYNDYGFTLCSTTSRGRFTLPEGSGKSVGDYFPHFATPVIAPDHKVTGVTYQ